ncbi:metal-dependent hydrolase [Legionella londiniensis]|uniref:Integral membrane protein n=1 Tax=Legionella londiniensis TaxID=45068 RepID=A0A0W0VP69_9GAMM|nr:metal-dependent hydrolase [Legionella londiniensis]KTD21902.1 integral membrane protein [Legionella londiniensis]STX92615.1 membrane-bound metal-dependent hydrolase [Legionella londiniensis]
MDPVTQAALGAACSQAILHQYDRKNAWIVGALGGTAADLDLLIRSANDPMLTLIYHRQFTHSFIFIPFGAILVTLALIPFQRFRERWRLTFWAAFIGYATHALLDTCTSYGTVLFWPLANTRYAWDLISIVDPVFTVFLGAGVIGTLVYDNRKPVFLGIILAGAFLSVNALQHHRALAAVQAYAHENHLQISRLRVFPELASSTHWRSVAFSGNKLVLARVATPWFSKSEVDSTALFPAFSGDELPDYVYHSGDQLRDLTIFNWFTDGYLLLVSRNPLILADARYIIGNESLRALWGIGFKPGKPHVDDLRMITLNTQDRL